MLCDQKRPINLVPILNVYGAVSVFISRKRNFCELRVTPHAA
jgi:hypothetical protein